MKPETKKEVILWGTIGVGAIVIYVATAKNPTTAPTPTSTRGRIPQKIPGSGPTTMPNPQQAPLDEAFLAARDQAIQAYDQTVLGERTAQDQLIATNNETRAQQLIAFRQDSTALKMSTIEGTTARDIAGTQASAAENIASQQASAMGQAEHAQQQQSLWGGILNFFGQAFSFLGFNNPYFNPVSYGSATVDASTLNPGNDIYTPTPDQQSWVDYVQPPNYMQDVSWPTTIGG